MVFLNGINRYIMECKSKSSNSTLILLLELIDTLWNVNIDITNQKFGHLRINRYIMECKYDSSSDKYWNEQQN